MLDAHSLAADPSFSSRALSHDTHYGCRTDTGLKYLRSPVKVKSKLTMTLFRGAMST